MDLSSPCPIRSVDGSSQFSALDREGLVDQVNEWLLDAPASATAAHPIVEYRPVSLGLKRLRLAAMRRSVR